LVWEAAQQRILEELSLDTLPPRIAEEPVRLSGSKIQVWRHRDKRQPRRVLPEKGHHHQRVENPTQSAKVSITGPEVPASESQRRVEPVILVEEGRSGHHQRGKDRKVQSVGKPHHSSRKTYTLNVVEGVTPGESSQARDVLPLAHLGGGDDQP
jgi:hypothetical protein